MDADSLDNRGSVETPSAEVDEWRDKELLAEPLPNPIQDQPPSYPDFGDPPVNLEMFGTELAHPKEENNLGYPPEEGMDPYPERLVWTRNPVAGILDKLRSAKYISKIDLFKGFLQIPLDPGSREKTCPYCKNKK